MERIEVPNPSENSVVVQDLLPNQSYLFKVKAPADSKGPWDYYEQVSVIPAAEAWRPLDQGGCSLVK